MCTTTVTGQAMESGSDRLVDRRGLESSVVPSRVQRGCGLAEAGHDVNQRLWSDIISWALTLGNPAHLDQQVVCQAFDASSD